MQKILVVPVAVDCADYHKCADIQARLNGLQCNGMLGEALTTAFNFRVCVCVCMCMWLAVQWNVGKGAHYCFQLQGMCVCVYVCACVCGLTCNGMLGKALTTAFNFRLCVCVCVCVCVCE
jgi:hypothetical protein